MSRFRLLIALCLPVLLATFIHSQESAPSEVVHPNQRVEVLNLPSLVVRKGTSAGSVALRIVLEAEHIRCDENSEIEIAARTAADRSLEDLINKIAGTSCVAERGPVKIAATFVPSSAVHGDALIAALMAQKPQLIQYEGAILVLYGVVYDEHLRSDGSRMNVVRKLLMLDPRYLGQRRFVTFIRRDDALGDIAGVAPIEPAHPN
ncbi:MAG: hypothetical protein ACXVZV_12555 [Terriglobales bacterium]